MQAAKAQTRFAATFNTACNLSVDSSKDVEKFSLRHHLDLSCLPEEKSKFLFRLNNYLDFVRLSSALGPQVKIRCRNEIYVGKELALTVALRCFCYFNRWGDTMKLLGCDRSQLSQIYKRTIDIIYAMYGYLLASLDQPWLRAQHIASFAQAEERASGARYSKSKSRGYPLTPFNTTEIFGQFLGFH